MGPTPCFCLRTVHGWVTDQNEHDGQLHTLVFSPVRSFPCRSVLHLCAAGGVDGDARFAPPLDLRHLADAHDDEDVEHGDDEDGHDAEQQRLDHVGDGELDLPLEAHDADGVERVQPDHEEVVGRDQHSDREQQRQAGELRPLQRADLLEFERQVDRDDPLYGETQDEHRGVVREKVTQIVQDLTQRVALVENVSVRVCEMQASQRRQELGQKHTDEIKRIRYRQHQQVKVG